MGKKEKLIERLKSNPRDFTFEEMQTLLTYLGFELSNKGRTMAQELSSLKAMSQSSCTSHTLEKNS
jgi:hypothetical protein